MTNTRQSLKFAAHLVDLIQSGQKWTTWRLFNDKNLQAGDTIELIARPDLEVFAEAEITSIKNKTLGTLDEIDRLGHEPVGDYTEMVSRYQGYYNRKVDSNTEVLVIKFKILNKFW